MRAQILVIDDDPIVCATVQHILRRTDYGVSTASNFPEALALAEGQSFDLLVTDLVMSDVDGAAVIRKFKNKFPQMPIVAMSGGPRLGITDTLAIARQAGADQLLRKPFGQESLLASINAALNRPV